MDEVWRTQLHKEGGQDIGEQNDCLGDIRTDEIEGGGQDDHIEDIVDQTYATSVRDKFVAKTEPDTKKPEGRADTEVGAVESCL